MNDPAKWPKLALVGPEIVVIAYGALPDPEIVAAYRERGVDGMTLHLPDGPEAEVPRTLDGLATLIGRGRIRSACARTRPRTFVRSGTRSAPLTSR